MAIERSPEPVKWEPPTPETIRKGAALLQRMIDNAVAEKEAELARLRAQLAASEARVRELEGIVVAVSVSDPITQDGGQWSSCYFCGADAEGIERDDVQHEEACEWVRSRALAPAPDSEGGEDGGLR